MDSCPEGEMVAFLTQRKVAYMEFGNRRMMLTWDTEKWYFQSVLTLVSS